VQWHKVVKARNGRMGEREKRRIGEREKRRLGK